jgi:acetyltransferase-like isoleucine patch superfamily enzyme
LKYLESSGEVVIKKAAIIYSGVIIKHGITIGEKAEIGAGSVVIKDIPAHSFWAGSPAKEKKCNI